MSNIPLPQNTLQAVNATLAQVIERLGSIESRLETLEKASTEPEPTGVELARAKHMLLDKLDGDRAAARSVWNLHFQGNTFEQVTESQLSKAMDKAIGFMRHRIQEERSKSDEV